MIYYDLKCAYCKYYWEDRDTGYSECSKEDTFSDEEIERLENCDSLNEYSQTCPYFEEYIDIDYEPPFESEEDDYAALA